MEERDLSVYDTAFGITGEAGRLMPAKTTSTSRDVEAELAFLTRALKAPIAARVDPTPGRTGPGRVLDLSRSSWPRACNARSPPASPTAAKAASAPPGSRPASPSRSSTSTTPAG